MANHMTQTSSQTDNYKAELSESIEQLYQMFAKYPLDPAMDGSPVYQKLMLDRWNQTLAAKPLRELSVEDLTTYHFKAMTTWGGVNDFKHFLPRLFELLSELPMDFDEWVTLDKLNYGNYKNWPDNEKTVIHRFLLAFWKKLLTEESADIDAGFAGYFSAIANVYSDFGQLLQIWLAADKQCSSYRLAAFVSGAQKKVLEKQVLPGYEDMPQQGKLFREWLRSPAVLNKLKQTVPSAAAPYIDWELIPVIRQLEQGL
ncbi:hypothetical protein IC235_02010 [Hymenobacter sp. BT664]|uniref:Uncharacterized protein n=1 Tax=Hymenobacter montanus TaxID=2771359 RepID=A0A927BAM1_9BACT|nr:hypothetical protein [Hymenobacter montanus]MBD2766664.1 hypothetical protein [Hymenobacter montanus]